MDGACPSPHGQPCPRCGGKVQRIVHTSNETNDRPACQTGGKLLADRALSRLLKQDWPRTLTELEELMARRK
jgi:formamidopyrimidine-DNA glycosylase